MQYTLRQLAYLVAVADHGSVTAAANALYTSQPGISSAIAQLEEQFGLQFFIRHHAKGCR
jgi:DNA-binding transcriptional LysR family regulator